MTRLGIAGAGRMGMAIADIAALSDDLDVAAIWTRKPEKVTASLTGPDTYIGNDLNELLSRSDVIIDFSLPEGTMQVCAAVADNPVPLVCGVSGLDDEQLSTLEALAGKTPVVYDRNMSLGITVLSRLVRDAAAALGSEFDVHIDETHHVHKKDAPSGTALKLGEAVAQARGEEFRAVSEVGEDGDAEAGSIRFHVERRGEVPGDHAVHFTHAAESLSFSHSVTTRDVFARGAIRAARWISGQQPGFYDMQDVLFPNSA